MADTKPNDSREERRLAARKRLVGALIRLGAATHRAALERKAPAAEAAREGALPQGVPETVSGEEAGAKDAVGSNRAAREKIARFLKQ